jgi:hypothetical protein
VLVLASDIHKVSRTVAARSDLSAVEPAEQDRGVGSAGQGGGDVDGKSSGLEEEDTAPNVMVSVFSLFVNFILSACCLFCAR